MSYPWKGNKKTFLKLIFKTRRELLGVQLTMSEKVKVQSLCQPWSCTSHGLTLTSVNEMKG